MIAQTDEHEPFIVDLLEGTKQNIQDLDHLRICCYYEAIGLMIASTPPPVSKREEYISRLMEIFNEIWIIHIRNLEQEKSFLCEDIETLKKISLVKIFIWIFYNMYLLWHMARTG